MPKINPVTISYRDPALVTKTAHKWVLVVTTPSHIEKREAEFADLGKVVVNVTVAGSEQCRVQGWSFNRALSNAPTKTLQFYARKWGAEFDEHDEITATHIDQHVCEYSEDVVLAAVGLA